MVKSAWRVGLVLGFAWLTTACGSASAEAAMSTPPPSTAGAKVLDTPTQSSTTARSGATTTTTQVDPCPATAGDGDVEAPQRVIEALRETASHPGFDGLDVGLSVWIDGWGEVVSRNPDLPLAPASNQKLLVAYAANALIDPEHRFETTIELAGDDLILRAGGDPTLTSTDLESLAAQVASAGIAEADRLVVDLEQYPQPSRAEGWLDWQIPTYVGPLSGLMLDDNRWTRDADFVADPSPGNGERVADILRAAGIDVDRVELGTAEPGAVVAAHESAPIGDLLAEMVQSSDNQHADLLVMELGRRTGAGTLAGGIDAMDAELAELCVPLEGESDDGSGLSRLNQRSARELRQLLRAMRTNEAGEMLRGQLPVGGVSGTLRSRFGDAELGRVQAKTGTIIGGRSLSGYATTTSGRDAVFSIIVNGDPDRAHASLEAIDALVSAVLRS